jgi:hypothetical protein
MWGVTALFLGVSWLSFDEIEEDAFIFYRVAENLADGEGFTFNRGGPPIECSSSLTYQLLLVPFALLSLDPIVPSKLLGIALGVLALWLTHWLGRRLMDDPLFACLPPLILAVSIPFYHWSQRGLETPLYVCTLLAAVWCALHPRLSKRWYLVAFAIVCTRPEGPFLALGLVLILAVTSRRREIEHFWPGVSTFLLLCGLLLAFRLLYFHDFVPNPFYIKFHGSLALGWAALRTYITSGGVLWILVPGLLAVLAGRRWSDDAVVIAGMSLCTTGWAVLGEDWKPYNRHVVPALPFLALLSVYAVRLVVGRPVLRIGMASYFVAVCLWILFEARAVYDFSETWANPLTHRDEPRLDPLARTPDSDRIGDNRHAAVGRFLRLNYPGHITIAYDQMGQTPWYAGLDKSFIDTLGLTNREVGVSLFDARNRNGVLGLYRSISQAILSAAWPEERRSLGYEGVLDYVFARAPHLFLFHEELLSLPNSVPSHLFRDPRLRERYRARFRLEESVRVFERKGFGAVSPWQAPEGCTAVEIPSS